MSIISTYAFRAGVHGDSSIRSAVEIGAELGIYG